MVYWLSSDRENDKQQKSFRELCSVPLEDSTVILAPGEGKVKLPTVNSIREIVLDLQQVLFVPKLTKNLYSVPAMALMGEEIHFQRMNF